MQSTQVMQIEERDFDKEVLSSNEPVFVDFYADWCGPCHAIEPTVEELAKTYDGKIRFVRLNVDYAQSVSSRYEIMSIPTLMIFKGGKPVSALIGAAPKSQFVRMIDGAISQ